MHLRRRYNVILGELEVFPKLQVFQYHFHENFRMRCNLIYNESKNFSDSSLHHIFEFENSRSPFF